MGKPLALLASLACACSAPQKSEPPAWHGASDEPEPARPGDGTPVADAGAASTAGLHVRAPVSVPAYADLGFAPLPADALLATGSPPPAERRVRLQQADMLRKLVDATPASSPDHPDLSYRLGDILAAEAFLQYADARAAAGTVEAKRLSDGARQLADQALRALMPAAKAASYARRDDVLFLAGRLAMALGRAAEARTMMMELLKNYPASQHVPHAYLLFGEYFLADGKLTEAEQFYDKVAQFPQAQAAVASALVQKGRIRLGRGELPAAHKLFSGARRLGQAARRPTLDAAAADGEALVLYYLAEHRWAAAAAQKDAATALESWREVARAFQAAADHPSARPEHKTEAQAAAKLATENAATLEGRLPR